MKTQKQLSPTQHSRQRKEHRSNGRYAKVNPCYRCGKSAGVNYASFHGDADDALGNAWHDTALCVCDKCWRYLDVIPPADAWVEAHSLDWGKLPQGHGPSTK